MSFTRIANYLLGFSGLLILTSLLLLVTPGPILSIEFTGGTLMELQLPPGTEREALPRGLAAYAGIGREKLAGVAITTTREGTTFVRMSRLENEEHLAILADLQRQFPGVKELRFTTIGSTVSSNLKKQAMQAFIVASIAIIAYLAFAFRNVPRHLGSWRFGIIAVVAVLHDVFITVGIFTILSRTTSFQFDTLFVSALLSIMGYSVNDTIVIFDRIRENLGLQKHADFASLAAQSIRQTLTRTMNTGLGVLFMLFTLYIFGAESIRWFILTFIIGTIIGTYSSFFFAVPLLMLWQRWTAKR